MIFDLKVILIVSDFRDKSKYIMFHADLAKRLEAHGLEMRGIKVLYQRHKKIFPYGYPYSYVPNKTLVVSFQRIILALPNARSEYYQVIELGIQCGLHRKGDTNIRMDAIVAFKDGEVGVVEIELAGAVLDSPRALLEDIAV